MHQQRNHSRQEAHGNVQACLSPGTFKHPKILLIPIETTSFFKTRLRNSGYLYTSVTVQVKVELCRVTDFAVDDGS